MSRHAQVLIRVAAAADAAALAVLRGAAGETAGGAALEDGRREVLERRLAHWMAERGAGRTTWIALAGAVPVGMVSLTEYRRMPRADGADSCWSYVGNLFVRADFRGRGVAGGLVAAAVEAADERGYVRLVVSPSARALGVFRDAGFASAAGDARTPLLVRDAPAG